MLVRVATTIVLFAVLAGLPVTAQARFFRSEQVPNGQKLDCGLCHTASNGDGPRNAFGTQIEMMGLDGEGLIQNQNVVWADIYMLDADEDGFTNGYELGDPDGTWDPVDGDPSVDPSLPGDPDSLPCPNGSRHPDEECDGDDFGDATCESLGFSGGMLLCNDDCTLDTSMCMGAENPDAGMGSGDDAGIVQPTPDLGGVDPVPPMDTGMSGSRPDASTTQGSGSGGRYGPYFDNPPPNEPGGCGGVLDVKAPDGGFDAAFLIVLFGWQIRRKVRSEPDG